MVRAAVSVGGAGAVGGVTALEQLITDLTGATLGVGGADLAWGYADPRQLIADRAATAVSVGAALHTDLERLEAVRLGAAAVCVAFAANADAIVVGADAAGAVIVRGTLLAAPRLHVTARGVVFIALGVRQALYAAISRPITAVAAWAVGVGEAGPADAGVGIAGAWAVVVGDAGHAGVEGSVTEQARIAVTWAEAGHAAVLPHVAAAPRAVGVGEAAHAGPIVGAAAAGARLGLAAVPIGEAADADALSAAAGA